MTIKRNQQTIAGTCRVDGRGYWSGEHVQVVLNPAPPGTGVCMIRSDLPGSGSCPMVSEFRTDAQLRTNFRRGDASFQMVEHLMAALYGLGVDNCFVEVDAEELPGLDGSCMAYVEAILEVGVQTQSFVEPLLVIDQTIRIESGDRWIEANPSLSGETYYEYRLGFDRPSPIPAQQFNLVLDAEAFAREVAPARTFVTEMQAAMLRGQGVASHVSNQDLLVFGSEGPLENTLRFDNECARHKTLDLIGDLAVSGVRLVGRFTSHRGGHSLNGRMSKRLTELALARGVRTGVAGARSLGRPDSASGSMRESRSA